MILHFFAFNIMKNKNENVHSFVCVCVIFYLKNVLAFAELSIKRFWLKDIN